MAASDAPTHALGGVSAGYGGSIGYGAAWEMQEHIPALSWPESVCTYNRMRTDPVCASILAAYIGPLMAADWRINPRGADPAIVALCADSLGLPVAGEDVADIGAVRRRGVKFVEHVRLACLHLIWGHFAFEPVYEVRSDGKAYLKALPERMPSTIVDIKVTDDGELKSIVQEGRPDRATTTPGGLEIPADRLLYYCHSREGANFVGRSLLRSCYSDWLLKVDAKRANAVGINRWSSGIPVAEPLPGTNPTPAQIEEAQRMVSSARGGETAGAVPVGFKLRIVGIDGQLPDAIPTIRMHNEEMARGSLTSVLDLGNTSNGSRALGDTFSEMLKGAIQAVGDYMAEVATQLCERLTTFNAGEDATPPEVSCGDVGASKAAIVTAITGLVAAGIVTPDEGLESYARDGYHLPPKDPTPEPPPAVPPPPPAVAASKDVSGWQPWVRAAGGADSHVGSERNLIRWFEHGEGAALVGYGTTGQFERCMAIAGKHMPDAEARGFCAERIHAVTGEWPGAHHVHAAADSEQRTGIMLALMVPPSDAAGLALDIDGAEPAEELHLTLAYLGKTTDVDDEAAFMGTVLNVLRDVVARYSVIDGQVSGSGRFSTPDGDAVYLSYDSPQLPDLRQDLFVSLRAAGIEPSATHGFSPHITLAYVPQGAPSPLDHVEVRDLSFAGVTFAYGGQQITAPLQDLTDQVAVGDWRINTEPSQVYAAADAPQPYREPPPQEQAAGIDPAAVDGTQDGLVAEGMTLFASIVAVWGAALAAQITTALAGGSLAALARLQVDSTDAAQGLAVLMREAADAGVVHVLDEARRAGIPAPTDTPAVDEAALDDAAAAAADLMGQGLASAAGREAARIAGPGSDPKSIARQAVATVTESDTPIHDAIQAGITRALGAGRAAAQEALMLGADLVPFATAIRDVNSCEPCLENDGYEYADLADALTDFPTGHYAECLGRGRCRCMIALRPAISGHVMAGRHSFNESDHPRNLSGPKGGQFSKAPTAALPTRRTGGSRVRVDPAPAAPRAAPTGRHKAPVAVRAPEPAKAPPTAKTPPKKAPAVKKAVPAKKAVPVKKAATPKPVKKAAPKKVTPAKTPAAKKTATKKTTGKPAESNDTIALKYYQFDGAQHINVGLRAGKQGEHRQLIAHMDKMLAATSTEKDMKVYRVASGMHFGNLKPGSTITDQAFLSTSNDRDAALSHMFRIEDDNPVLFEIDLPKGSHALDMNAALPDSPFKGEKEFILPRGMKVRVVSVTPTKLTGKYYSSRKTVQGQVVKLEIVPEVSGG